MAVINEGIRIEENDSISFGNYMVSDKLKAKIDLYGDEYGLKTHTKVTRLEKNGTLLFEAVPGASVFNFSMTEDVVSFRVESSEDIQITLELLPESEYRLILDDNDMGNVQTNRSGKVNISVESDGGAKSLVLLKCIRTL